MFSWRYLRKLQLVYKIQQLVTRKQKPSGIDVHKNMKLVSKFVHVLNHHFVLLGLFLSHLLGTFLHWKTTAFICSLIPIISAILMTFTPESPSWWAKKGQLSKAEKSFHWCRGYSEEAKKELVVMLDRHKDQESSSRITMRDLLVPEFLKPLGVIMVYIVANQWAGVNAITFYTVSIMRDTIGEGVDEYLSMLIVDIIRVLMYILACVLLRKLGRRPLAVVSGTGTFLALFTLSAFTYAAKIHPGASNMAYIPMTALVVYISFISIGFVPLPWAMIGEVFPLRTRSIGSGVTSFLAFTAFFSVVKTSPAMFRGLGTDGTFLVYGLVAFFGTIFVWVYLPETKGRPLHEIEEEFRKNRKCAVANGGAIS